MSRPFLYEKVVCFHRFASHQATLWHPKLSAYRCCLPTLTGFTVFRRTGPSN